MHIAHRTYSELLNPKAELNKTDQKGLAKSLNDIMKVELLQDKTKAEIEHIWLEYHKGKEVVVATIPMEKLNKQMESGQKYPLFVIPLPRSQGYEFFLLQFAANTVHFTPLICYQVISNLPLAVLNNIFFVYRHIKKMHPSVWIWFTTPN